MPQDWNVIVTVRPGPEHVHRLLSRLGQECRFARTPFKDVLVGRVDDLPRFLDTVLEALEARHGWAALVGRVVPAQCVFAFTPDTLVAKLKENVAPLVAEMSGGTFCFRFECRGMAQHLASQEIERTIADYVFALAQARGATLSTRLKDPDYLLVAQTLGAQCGVALLDRRLRSRYPFVQTR